MRTVISILGVENRETYYITHLMTDDGSVSEFWSKTIPAVFVGDRVEVFYDSKWNKIKSRLTPT